MTAASLILGLAQGYFWIGVLVAIGFLGVRIGALHPDARDSYLFRVVVAPGVVATWPLVLVLWRRMERRHRGGGAA